MTSFTEHSHHSPVGGGVYYIKVGYGDVPSGRVSIFWILVYDTSMDIDFRDVGIRCKVGYTFSKI